MSQICILDLDNVTIEIQTPRNEPEDSRETKAYYSGMILCIEFSNIYNNSVPFFQTIAISLKINAYFQWIFPE